MSLIFVLGGARSGKSSYAEKIVESAAEVPAYIATSQVLDREMEERVRLHRERRSGKWVTYEEPYDVADLVRRVMPEHDAALLDCLTLLSTNYILRKGSYETIGQEAIAEAEGELLSEIANIADYMKDRKEKLVIVSNEIGCGVVPVDPITRGCRDVVGRMNQFTASAADEVVAVYAGIPLQIKPFLEVKNER